MSERASGSSVRSGEDRFGPQDDDLHPPSASFYETEAFWFSFFVPERDLGAWLYASVRQNAGTTAGGMWIWDATGADPWDVAFYQQFGHLKPPTAVGPGDLDFATGLTIRTRVPGTSYDLGYDDRDGTRLELRFEALEEAVPLRRGAPPYPVASHYDQTGHVTGHLLLDGERIEVDCYAMRDRSWGPRHERGYHRVGYTWAASPELSVLTYTRPEGSGPEHVYAGYIRRGEEVAAIVDGTREVRRDRRHGWVTAIDAEIVDEHGRTAHAHADGGSHMILPHSTSVCVNTALTWAVDGAGMHGEDQDVWPMKDWRALRRAVPAGAGPR
jgi:hypothetical protein